MQNVLQMRLLTEVPCLYALAKRSHNNNTRVISLLLYLIDKGEHTALDKIYKNVDIKPQNLYIIILYCFSACSPCQSSVAYRKTEVAYLK